MTSEIHIDELLAAFVQLELERDDSETNWFHSVISHWDFQDTDDDNEIECYFYFRDQLEKDELDRVTAFINRLLRTDNAEPMVTNKSEDEEMRLEFIVSIAHFNGEKFK